MATWNVGGKTPTNGLNLEELLQVEGSADIYVLGYEYDVHFFAFFVLLLIHLVTNLKLDAFFCSSIIIGYSN